MPQRIPRAVAAFAHADMVSFVLIIAVLGVFALSGVGLFRTIKQGRETHAVLCSYKGDMQRRYNDSQKFLLMTPAERTAKYGKQLANIPESTVRRSMDAQKSILDSLSSLSCP